MDNTAFVTVKTMGVNGQQMFKTTIIVQFQGKSKEIDSKTVNRDLLGFVEEMLLGRAIAAVQSLQFVGIHADLINHCALSHVQPA